MRHRRRYPFAIPRWDCRLGFVASRHRPGRSPLTKGLWKADAPDSIWRKTEEAKVDLHLGRRVRAVDATSRCVTDDRGATYGYRRLLLATGGAPRRLPDAPEGVIYLRTLDDYRTTRQLADRGAGFVVLGGGFIGAEIAAALRMQGREVTTIVPGQGLGARVFPVELSRFLVEYYRERGVRMQIGESAERVERRDERFVVHAQRGGAIVADAVIAGLGIVPSVDLARQAGLTVSDGIEVDERLRSSQPEIYLDGGRVRGVLLWNTWGQVEAARELIAQPGPLRPEQLTGRLPAGHSPAGGT